MYIAKIDDKIYNLDGNWYSSEYKRNPEQYIAKQATFMAGLYSPYNKDEQAEVELYQVDGIEMKHLGKFKVWLTREPMDRDDYKVEINNLIEEFSDPIKELIWYVIWHSDMENENYDKLFEYNKHLIKVLKDLIKESRA